MASGRPEFSSRNTKPKSFCFGRRNKIFEGEKMKRMILPLRPIDKGIIRALYVIPEYSWDHIVIPLGLAKDTIECYLHLYWNAKIFDDEEEDYFEKRNNYKYEQKPDRVEIEVVEIDQYAQHTAENPNIKKIYTFSIMFIDILEKIQEKISEKSFYMKVHYRKILKNAPQNIEEKIDLKLWNF